jgi:hypothetical protein
MRAEFEALCAAIETGTGRAAHLVTAPPSAGTCYYLVSPAGATRGEDLPLSDVSSVWDGLVRIKAVSPSPAGAMADLAEVRAVLFPGGVVGYLDVEGRAVTLVFVRHEADYTEAVTVVTTNTPLALSVDSIRMVSVPDGTEDES